MIYPLAISEIFQLDQEISEKHESLSDESLRNDDWLIRKGSVILNSKPFRLNNLDFEYDFYHGRTDSDDYVYTFRCSDKRFLKQIETIENFYHEKILQCGVIEENLHLSW